MQPIAPGENTLLEIAWRLLPGSERPIVERAAGGVSTPVFRICRGAMTLYLRLAESAEANLAPEVLAHGLLRERGVRVPEVIYCEPFNEALGRSLMLTREIPGDPIGAMHHDVDVAAVLMEAGRQLALIHTVPVDGFGWIRRDRPDATRLQAALPTLRAFALEDLPGRLATLGGVLPAGYQRIKLCTGCS